MIPLACAADISARTLPTVLQERGCKRISQDINIPVEDRCPVCLAAKPIKAWSSTEIQRFLWKLMKYGKEFDRKAEFLKNRSGEDVATYYMENCRILELKKFKQDTSNVPAGEKAHVIYMPYMRRCRNYDDAGNAICHASDCPLSSQRLPRVLASDSDLDSDSESVERLPPVRASEPPTYLASRKRRREDAAADNGTDIEGDEFTPNSEGSCKRRRFSFR